MSSNISRSQARFGGIDAVKLAAAFLVVAIHTGPLLSYGEFGDFLLTGIFARLAVPLFFMASGYLFFRKLQDHPRKDGRALRKYGSRIAALYAIAILIYLPLNVYKGDFAEGVKAGPLIRDVLVDGTFYHLWYLPALWLGIYLVYYLHKKLPLGSVLAVTVALYVVGLLGDSYYGLAKQSPVLGSVYDWLFLWFDYTRNGLFFAPVFLALGLWVARRYEASGQERSVRESRGYTADRRKSVTGSTLGLTVLFLLSLAGLFAEGIALRAAEWPRHDSMYVMLLPAVAILFLLALRVNIRALPLASNVSQWLYLLHPAVIVVVRGVSGAAGMDKLLVEHSLIHYIAVCVLSLAAALAVALITERRKRKRARTLQDTTLPSGTA